MNTQQEVNSEYKKKQQKTTPKKTNTKWLDLFYASL